MRINIETEDLKTLAAAGEWLGTRTGKAVPYTTIDNWWRLGIDGVKLETVKIGRTRYTSTQALGRFFRKLGGHFAAKVPAREEAKRQLADDMDRLREMGVKV